MELYPAVDIRGGEAVRLTRGDFGREDRYGDPLELARRFVEGGARWLHVVDLDAARTGRATNREAVLQIAESVEVPVQCGGGVRTRDDVGELLDGGVSRVVLGTAVLEDPSLVVDLAGEQPGRVAVAIDYRRARNGATEVAVRGWEGGSGTAVHDVLAGLAGTGVAALVLTAIDRDGTLEGPDVEGLTGVLESTDLPVIASGGIGSTADVEVLARLRIDAGDGDRPAQERRLSGAISGRALVDGRMTVEEGIAACARFG